MPIRRKFIDPSRPALDAACGFLLSQHHSGNLADLRNVLVVVPGRRVGRRLLEILVTAAGRESLVLTPPRIETVGRLPEHLYPQQRPLANDLVQTLAWLDVLKRVSLDTIAPFVPTPPDPEETSSWLELAELLRRQHTELAGDGLDFADVERQAPADEARRWRAMRILQKSYLRRLDALQLWDVQTARLVAIQQRECHATANIVLVGTADMNVATRQMLVQSSRLLRLPSSHSSPASTVPFGQFGRRTSRQSSPQLMSQTPLPWPGGLSHSS